MPIKAKYLAVLTLAISLLAVPAQAWADKGTIQILGTYDGAFNRPSAVAVNEATGHSYVLDQAYDRIQVFDSSGAYLSRFGKAGSGNGQFKGASGLSIDQSSGNIHVADTGNNRIQVFDSSGNYLSQFGTKGTGNGQFNTPLRVDVAQSSDNIYVSDSANDRIQVFDSSGNYLFQFGSSGGVKKVEGKVVDEGEGKFNSPNGVAVDESSGNLYVADTNNDRVQVFDSAGKFLFMFGISGGTGNGQFEKLMDVSINQASGKVYALDSQGIGIGRVQIFDLSGNYLSQFGSSGSTGGQFIAASEVVVDQSTGNLHLTDQSNQRVQVFAETGDFIHTFGKGVNETTGGDICTAASGDICRRATNTIEWRGIAVNHSTGNMYAASNDHVDVFGPSGNLLLQFGTPGGGAGQMSSVQGIAINQNTGDVYLTDQGNVRVARFNSAGNFISTWGNDVNATTPGTGFEICTAASGNTCKTGTQGNGKGQIWSSANTFRGVRLAIGPDGRVYVAEPGWKASNNSVGNRRVEVFSAEGEWLSEFTFPHEPEPCGGPPLPGCEDVLEPHSIAVDSTGVVYTAPDTTAAFSQHPLRVKKYTGTGNFIGVFADALVTDQRPELIAVDPTNNNVFIHQLADNGIDRQVAEYTSAGKLVEVWGLGIPSSASGLAVNPNSDRVYVSTQDGLFILGDVTITPIASIASATDVSDSNATFHGSVNPQGTELDTGWHFEYRQLGSTTWSVSPTSDVFVGNGSSDIPVEHEVTGLDPNTTYEARLVASRELGAGVAISLVTTFTTAAAPPGLSLIAATKVTDTTATLQASIDPRHAATTYRFEYGPDTGYGAQAPAKGPGDGGSQLGGSSAFEPVTGLVPGTTYHFRLVAENAGGTTESDDFTFVTHASEEMDWPERGIQLINQPDAGNQPVQPGTESDRPVMTPDGNRVLWKTLGGAPGSTTGYQALYLSERTAAGWSSRRIGVEAPEQVEGGDSAYRPSAVSEDLTGYAMTAESGFFSQAYPHTLIRMTDDGGHEYVAELGEGEKSLIDRSLHVTSGATHLLYEDPFTKNLVDFHDGSNEVLPAPSCGLTIPSKVRYASEPDTARVFFTSPGFISSGNVDCEAPQGLFMLDRDQESPAPELISGPQTDAVQFLGTDKSGSVALFVKEGNLHRWTEAGGAECVTCGELPGGVSIIRPFASSDASHVYFCGKVLPDGACDGYVWREEGIAFVARAKLPVGGAFAGPAETTSSASTSPDGTTLLFSSSLTGTTADPTGWDGISEGDIPNQLFRYSDETGVVECISCTGTATPPDGGVGSYVVSPDGTTIAFVTSAALLSEDINDRQDVYESHNGRLRLVTDGETEFPVGDATNGGPDVWGLSEDGRTLVFSAGGAAITGHEVNPFANAYAATVGGEEIPVELPPAPCIEDACQGPLQASPRLDSQGSSTFHGQGSVSERKAAKRKKRGKKVKQKHRRAKQRTKRQQESR